MLIMYAHTHARTHTHTMHAELFIHWYVTMYTHITIIYVHDYYMCIYSWLLRYIINVHCHDADSVIVTGYYVRKYIRNYYALKAYLEGLTIKNDVVL